MFAILSLLIFTYFEQSLLPINILGADFIVNQFKLFWNQHNICWFLIPALIFFFFFVSYRKFCQLYVNAWVNMQKQTFFYILPRDEKLILRLFLLSLYFAHFLSIYTSFDPPLFTLDTAFISHLLNRINFEEHSEAAYSTPCNVLL